MSKWLLRVWRVVITLLVIGCSYVVGMLVYAAWEFARTPPIIYMHP